MPPLTALLDANVLYSADLRSLLLYLAVQGIYRARWSDDIHEEWISSLLEKRPDLSRDKLERTRDLMNRHAPDALVTGYEHLIPALTLPDPNDRHVLAAAIQGNADVIVTNNIKDFPGGILEQYDIEVQIPDEFICQLIGLYPNEVRNAAEEHRSKLRNPPKSIDEYLDSLERQGLIETCRGLRKFLEL